MPADVSSHLIDQIASISIKTEPYFYFHSEKIFPNEFYKEMLDTIPDISLFSPLPSYPERHSFNLTEENIDKLPDSCFLFWNNFSKNILNEKFLLALLSQFQPQLKMRFGETFSHTNLDITASLTIDRSNYSIGPHTDHPKKVLTLLFYLPKSSDQIDLGTSIYVPRDRNFRCPGIWHHYFEDFKKIYTAPYVPNSVFGFFKSDISFHGVEPLGNQPKERIVLCYTVFERTEN